MRRELPQAAQAGAPGLAKKGQPGLGVVTGDPSYPKPTAPQAGVLEWGQILDFVAGEPGEALGVGGALKDPRTVRQNRLLQEIRNAREHVEQLIVREVLSGDVLLILREAGVRRHHFADAALGRAREPGQILASRRRRQKVPLFKGDSLLRKPRFRVVAAPSALLVVQNESAHGRFLPKTAVYGIARRSNKPSSLYIHSLPSRGSQGRHYFKEGFP